MNLPDDPDPRSFDALHDDPSAWRGVVLSLARELGVPDPALVRQETEGTVLVARLGRTRVLKLYPPFLRDHFEFECEMLQALHGRLRVPTPQLLARGARQGWPWLLMSQLQGQALTLSWPRLSEPQRLRLLAEIGALCAQVHALPLAAAADLAPTWTDFLARQRERCAARQRATGLPQALQQVLPAFMAGPVPQGPPVRLTGEYTPMNLFTRAARLAAMFDFGDGLVGPREYDWLGPLCFLTAGSATRTAAFLGGYGVVLDAGLRVQLLRLLLLHRYSNLPAQIACSDWQQETSFEALAARLWPLAGEPAAGG